MFRIPGVAQQRVKAFVLSGVHANDGPGAPATLNPECAVGTPELIRTSVTCVDFGVEWAARPSSRRERTKKARLKWQWSG